MVSVQFGNLPSLAVKTAANKAAPFVQNAAKAVSKVVPDAPGLGANIKAQEAKAMLLKSRIGNLATMGEQQPPKTLTSRHSDGLAGISGAHRKASKCDAGTTSLNGC